MLPHVYLFILFISPSVSSSVKQCTWAGTRILHLSLFAAVSSAAFMSPLFTALPSDWSVSLRVVFGLSLLLCPLGLQHNAAFGGLLLVHSQNMSIIFPPFLSDDV